LGQKSRQKLWHFVPILLLIGHHLFFTCASRVGAIFSAKLGTRSFIPQGQALRVLKKISTFGTSPAGSIFFKNLAWIRASSFKGTEIAPDPLERTCKIKDLNYIRP